MAFIDSGRLRPETPFRFCPPERLEIMVEERRRFIHTHFRYGCSNINIFLDDAKEYFGQLGYKSPEHMIREGYEMDPEGFKLVSAWANHNEGEASTTSYRDILRKIAGARVEAASKQGQRTDLQPLVNNEKSEPTNSVRTMLRRLVREGREDLIERIGSGELSVNAAAIEAGFRKKQISVPVGDAEAAVRRLLKHFDREELLAAIQAAPADSASSDPAAR